MNISPIAARGYDFVATVWPGLLLAGALILAWPAAHSIWRSLRAADQWIHEQLQALPAPAADNQADTDRLAAGNGISSQPREEKP